MAGVERDHVRIGQNGVVDGSGKFDELLVPAGARFTFEVRVLDDADVRVDDLVEVLNQPEVRVGRGGRRGLGGTKVVRWATRRFDLTESSDFDAWCTWPVDVYEEPSDTLYEWQDSGASLSKHLEGMLDARYRRGRLRLDARDTWYFGGTIHPEADLLAQRHRGGDDTATELWRRFGLAEKRIVWSNGQGQVAERAEWVVPASSVKGALRHRVAFWGRVLEGRLLEPGTSTDESDALAAPAAESWWFGTARDDDSGAGDMKAGRIVLGDARVSADDVRICTFDHVSIDRFTQGTLDGRLFDEATLFGGGFEVDIALDLGDVSEAPPHAREALRRALDDLCSGSLALGAATTRGHGAFEGRITWTNGSDPLREAV